MHRVVVILVLLMIGAVLPLDAQQPEAATPEFAFHTQVNLLSVAVRVTDRKDNEIHGLTANQFSLYEDSVLQKISFFDAEDEPVSLGILLDLSGSMEATGKLDHAKDVLTRLISTMRPEDEMFYLRFHREVDKIVGFTNDPHQILRAISTTGPTKDGTSLYDAVAKALCAMRSAHHRRQALLVVTDGADQHSHRSLEELISLVQASQVQVFIIGYFSKEEYDLYRSSRDSKVALVTNQEIDNPLLAFKQLATESGAESFFPPSPAKLQQAVEALAHQLRTQYTLAYYTKLKGSGFHRIEVKVAHSGARVRARRGFEVDERTMAGGPPGPSARCKQEELRPYPYESKTTTRNGCTVYHENFQNGASGWPNKERFHYRAGTYEIRSGMRAAREQYFSSSPNAPPPSEFSAGDIDSSAPPRGTLVANGPWFDDFNASVSVEMKPGGGAGDVATAAGLVFRLNDRGYYAVILSKSVGSGGVQYKLIKKFHPESAARDLLPWAPMPLSDLIGGRQNKISVQCRGKVIKILFSGNSVTKIEDSDFAEGLVGMILYGDGRAVFRDLLVEEVCDSR